MKHISLLKDLPPSGWDTSRVYSLVWKPRYDDEDGGLPPKDLAEVRYLVDGERIEGAIYTFEVDDQLEFSREGAGPGAGGVLRLLLSTRRVGLTRDEFAHHWRTVHAPLALELGPSYDHYITNIIRDESSPWDGVLQEWFKDKHTFETHDDGLNGRKKAVADDYPLFLATSAKAPQWIGTEIYPSDNNSSV